RARGPAGDVLRLHCSGCDERARGRSSARREVVESPTAAGAVAVDAAVALEDQAARRPGYLIQDQEMKASPAMIAVAVSVRLALVVSAGRSADQQCKCDQGDGQRQTGKSCECSSSHLISSLRI